MYKYLLWDIDGTLLNFEAAERQAMKALFVKHGLSECSDEMISDYSKINKRYWQALERGEMTKKQILVGRFEEYFESIGVDTSIAEAFNADYQVTLGDFVVFEDDAIKVLDAVKDKFRLCAVTNGTKVAQEKKLKTSGLNAYFDAVYISEDIGIEKPNAGFFDIVFEKENISDLSEVLIIGDSLTSDILGGNNAGIDTCWYNPGCDVNTKNVNVKYEIQKLEELLKILI